MTIRCNFSRHRGPAPLLPRLASGALVLCGAALLSGCGDDKADSDSGSDAAGGAGGDTSDVAPATGSDPLYALMIQVYTPDWDRNVYVHLTQDLDVSEIDLTQAREFPGVANFTGIDGRILVSSGLEPIVEEFGITDDLKWVDGRTVSFASFPVGDNANFYAQFILDNHTAYLPYDTVNRVVWNPADMTLGSSLEDTNLVLEKDGLQLNAGGNRNAIQFDGPVQQAFFYVDQNWTQYGPESVVAIYDQETHEEKELITLPCPGLSMASQDEQGFTYYGSWDFQGTRALFGEGPEPCIARLKPDLTLDQEWTTDLTDVTDGRYHNNFRYIGGGKAIANVLHHELLEDADFDSGFDADVADAIQETGPHWKLWLIDLEAGSGAPVEGVDVEISSGAQFAVLEGRTFVFLPYNDWGNSKIYEIDADGAAVERGDTVGDVFKWVKIR